MSSKMIILVVAILSFISSISLADLRNDNNIQSNIGHVNDLKTSSIENDKSRQDPTLLNSTTKRQKIHIRVATVELAPFMMKKFTKSQDNPEEIKIEWHGYCVDFFDELIKNIPYEVTYDMYQVSENKFGSRIKQMTPEIDKSTNKTIYKKSERWTGIIGDLEMGKADLALAPLAVMAERELAIDFTVPFYDLVGIQILLKKPEVTRDIFKFLTVLDNEVWLSIAVAFFVTSFVIFLFDRLSPYSHKNSTRIKRLRRQHIKNTRLLNDKNMHMNINFHEEVKNNAHSIDPEVDKMNNSKFNETNCIQSIVRYDYSDNQQAALMKPSSNNQNRNQSWTDSIKEVGRRSSLFLAQGFNGILNKYDATVHPGNDFNEETLFRPKAFTNYKEARESRASRVLNDYLKQIDFKRKDSSSISDDSDLIDLDDGKPDFGFRDSLWFCITSLTPQGGGEAPMNLSGRVVAGAWWLFCFIIIASYTANLAAFLTVSRLDIPIESLDDLVKQYRIKFAPVEGTAEQAYFERMAYIEEIFYNIWRDMSLNESLSEEERSKFAVWDYPISDKYTKIWAQIQQVGMPADHEIGIQRVMNSTLEEGFALLADANTIKHAVITDCRVKAVGDEFSRKPIALGVRKGQETLRDDLSHAILKLINQRFMEILREKWWNNNPDRVNCDEASESEGIGIENIGGVFIIIAAGVLLSFMAWLIERIAYQTRINISRDLMSN